MVFGLILLFVTTLTRNTDTYKHGRMWLKDNKAYNNGINGLVVHKTDRAHVVGNIIWDNGQVMEILKTISTKNCQAQGQLSTSVNSCEVYEHNRGP